MSLIVNMFLMVYLLVMMLLSILAVFWAATLIFRPESTSKKDLVRH